MTLPEFSIRRPVTTLVILISIFVIGGIAVYKLPLAFMPDKDKMELYVNVRYPNASPQVVERTVTRPIEEALGSISGITNLWSRCDQNGAMINFNFDWTVNLDNVRMEMRDRLDRLRPNLPKEIERIQITENWDAYISGETIMEARISSGRDLSRDFELLDRKIIKPLERIPGVAAVHLDGVNPREVKIDLDLTALRRHRIDARAVYMAIQGANLDLSLGVVRNENFRYNLRATGSFEKVAEIAALPIPGTGLHIHDVAAVTYTDPPLEYGRHIDMRFAVGVSVSKESSANTVEVSKLIHQTVAQISKDPDLEGIDFLVWMDQGKEILKTINDLKQTGLLGGILAALVLFFFLRRLATTFVALLCIPFSVIVACGIVWAQGKTMNTVTLLGLIVGIGMLVDNAVVIMENIDRYQRKGFSARISALLGARQVATAVLAATLTSVIVFLPLIFNKPSDLNIILRELAYTVIFTLLASLFISQTLIPLAAARFNRDAKPRKPGAIMTWLEEKYGRLLAWILHHRAKSLALGLLVVASVYYPFQKVDKNFQTQPNELFVGTAYHFSENLSLARKGEIVLEVEKALMPHKAEFHIAQVYSFWSPEWTLTRLYMEEGYANETEMNKIRKVLPSFIPKIPGVRVEVQDNIPFWMRNRGKRIAYELRGPDTEVLGKLAAEAKAKLETLPGLFDHYTTAEQGKFELQAKVDRNRARAYGVGLERPGESMELTFRGQKMNKFKGPDGEVEMRLTLDENQITTLDQLKNLPIARKDAAPLGLDNFADFELVKTPDAIVRNNKITGVWVGAKFEEGDKEALMAQSRALFESIDLPFGYAWDFQSFNKGEEESQREFLLNLGFALLLIFAVMAGLFESMRQATALMVSLPFAITGAFWALYLSKTTFDPPAAVGLLLLLGVVVNNGIVLVEHINGYRRNGMARDEAMLLGCRERLRPIMMTALTTLMGLVPMAVQKPSLGGVYYYSMAYVIIGGLFVSTFLTCLLLPSTVSLIEDGMGWVGKKLGLIGEWKPAESEGLGSEA